MTLTTRQIIDRRQASTAFPGLVDPKGRQLGVHVDSMEVEFTALPETATSGFAQEPGLWFAAQVSQMRAGRLYGASQPTQYFRTAAERQAYVDRRRRDVEARCRKLAQ